MFYLTSVDPVYSHFFSTSKVQPMFSHPWIIFSFFKPGVDSVGTNLCIMLQALPFKYYKAPQIELFQFIRFLSCLEIKDVPVFLWDMFTHPPDSLLLVDKQSVPFVNFLCLHLCCFLSVRLPGPSTFRSRVNSPFIQTISCSKSGKEVERNRNIWNCKLPGPPVSDFSITSCR